MVEATTLPVPYQVRFRAGENTGLADTVKEGVGGTAGMRPHELLEAALATCMTMSARMALAELGRTDVAVTVAVFLEREESSTRFRYHVTTDPALDDAAHRVVVERIERSPVRRTLSKTLSFEPTETPLQSAE